MYIDITQSDYSTPGSGFQSIKPGFTSTDSEFPIYTEWIYTCRRKGSKVTVTLVYRELVFKKVMIKNLPLLARCFIVSICSPDSFAFFIAEVALGHPDKL